METALVVVRPFGRYAVGDVITDAGEAARIGAGEHADNVVRVPHQFSSGPSGSSDMTRGG